MHGESSEVTEDGWRSEFLRYLMKEPAKIVSTFGSDGMKVEEVQRGMYCCLIEKSSKTGLGMLSYSAGQSHDVKYGEGRIGSEQWSSNNT